MSTVYGPPRPSFLRACHPTVRNAMYGMQGDIVVCAAFPLVLTLKCIRPGDRHARNAMHGLQCRIVFRAQRLGQCLPNAGLLLPLPDVTLCSRLILHCRLSLRESFVLCRLSLRESFVLCRLSLRESFVLSLCARLHTLLSPEFQQVPPFADALEHPFRKRGLARLGLTFLPPVCGTTLRVVICAHGASHQIGFDRSVGVPPSGGFPARQPAKAGTPTPLPTAERQSLNADGSLFLAPSFCSWRAC